MIRSAWAGLNRVLNLFLYTVVIINKVEKI